jgi:hypothetical protein
VTVWHEPGNVTGCCQGRHGDRTAFARDGQLGTTELTPMPLPIAAPGQGAAGRCAASVLGDELVERVARRAAAAPLQLCCGTAVAAVTSAIDPTTRHNPAAQVLAVTNNRSARCHCRRRGAEKLYGSAW